MQQKIYLAGPDVFRQDALAIGAAKKALCEKYGYVGLFPLDNTLDLEGLSPFHAGVAIYQANVELMNHADLIIANMTPFRGQGMDQGTAFEMGYFAAQGKPLHGYTLETQLYHARTPHDEKGVDPNGLIVENFDMADNLMMVAAIEKSHGILLAEAGDDAEIADHLSVFEHLLIKLSEQP